MEATEQRAREEAQRKQELEEEKARRQQVINDTARKAEEVEENLRREAALEKARKAADSHRAQMRDSFDDFEEPEPIRSTSRLSWRDDIDSFSNDRGSIDTFSFPGPVAP